MALCAPTQRLSLVSYAKARRTSRRLSVTVRMAAASDLPAYEEGQLERPKWAGETPLSRLVGALVTFKPISSVLKFGARQVLISTAEKNDIPWREMAREILESDVYKEMESIQNPSIIYPDYYLNPFHAYDEGNLSWLAAAEAEAANLSMTKRAIPYASSVDEADLIMRGNWLGATEQHHQQYCRVEIRDILDIGCSVGVSTKHLADRFPSAKVTGLDLSPYFLAVAQLKEKKRAPRKNPINWIHAKGEDTGGNWSMLVRALLLEGFDKASTMRMYCAITDGTLFHECPEKVIIDILKEAYRLLRPGGTITMEDIAPKSKKLQELPLVLFTLMKSTEPFLDEYCLTDLEGRMREAGFANIRSVLTSPRHRTVTASVPL